MNRLGTGKDPLTNKPYDRVRVEADYVSIFSWVAMGSGFCGRRSIQYTREGFIPWLWFI